MDACCFDSEVFVCSDNFKYEGDSFALGVDTTHLKRDVKKKKKRKFTRTPDSGIGVAERSKPNMTKFKPMDSASDHLASTRIEDDTY